jgi:hypothetical protein
LISRTLQGFDSTGCNNSFFPRVFVFNASPQHFQLFPYLFFR